MEEFLTGDLADDGLAEVERRARQLLDELLALEEEAGSDGLLCEMRRINGSVSARRKHPNATGFEKNLYRTEGLPADQEQHLEVNFMTPLDTAANLAFERIMRGDSAPWDSEQRRAWTRYILSLMFRNPA